MDVARADAVDAEFDRLISKRASRYRMPDSGEREELWQASVDAYNEKRQQIARLEWQPSIAARPNATAPSCKR